MKKILLAIIMATTLSNALDDDKKKHMMAGAMIYGTCVIFGGATEALGFENYFTYKTCLVPVFVAGIGKEIYDSRNDGHTAEAWDAIATVAIPVALSFTIYEW